jgi:predicted phage terminase large subunit-like protein
LSTLTAAMVEGFVKEYLLADFAMARPVTSFHREWLEMACLPDPNVALAAPRGHAKSTLYNISFSLAAAILRAEPFQLKISRSRPLAVEYLRSIKYILTRNEHLIEDFGILPVEKWSMNSEDDFICESEDGYQFRMSALGFEQNMRGTTWGTRRPGLIICDDIEDPEAILSRERMDKNMNLFMGTLKPMGHVNCRFRMIGTVLGMESLLQRFIETPEWTSRVYEAHNDDMSVVLWPEMFPKVYWISKKAEYASTNNMIQYNMEYRNIAVDTSSGYFQSTDFVETDDTDLHKKKVYYVGVDYAISTKERRDFTVMIVGGVDSDGYLTIADVRKGRWDGKQILDEMFSIQQTFDPDQWFVESGAIQKALGAALEIESRQRNSYLPLNPMVPTKDKASRARSIQTRMRSRAVRFDKRSPWFSDLEAEMIQFPRGKHDDQVDAMAWLGLGLANMVAPPEQKDQDRLDYLAAKRAQQDQGPFQIGRSQTTGY